jgi:hypothetical protein
MSYFSGLSWNLVQNTWIRPKNTSRAIWSFLEFKVDLEKINYRLRQFDQSIICTANNSINRLSVEPTSINRDAIDRISERHKIDRSTSHLPKGPDISKFVRSKSKVDFYRQNWTPTSSVCAARIDHWWVKSNLYIYEISV